VTPETAEADQEVDEKEGAAEERLGVTELAERLGRDVGALLQRELELSAARNSPALRRTARTIVAWSVAGIAFATAFALANWAAVQALDAVLPGWAAPLVLAAAWAVLGGALVATMLLRSPESAGVGWWSVLTNGEGVVAECERARDQAQHVVHETLGELAAAVGREAEARIASAVVPIAGGIVDAGEDLVEGADEMLEDVVEDLPGGSLVGQAVDLVLLPGRWSLRIVTTALKGSPNGGE
jgi:Putative Actinobacterial Holin-X, holin superfamily III